LLFIINSDDSVHSTQYTTYQHTVSASDDESTHNWWFSTSVTLHKGTPNTKLLPGSVSNEDVLGQCVVESIFGEVVSIGSL